MVEFLLYYCTAGLITIIMRIGTSFNYLVEIAVEFMELDEFEPQLSRKAKRIIAVIGFIIVWPAILFR